MGKYNAANVAILNTPSYLGVDYAPPTPAPAKEHIIGEEDEVDTAEPVSRGHIRKPSQPPAQRQPSSSSLRPPAIPPPVAKPSSSQRPPSGSREAMAPPHLPKKPSPKLNQSAGAKNDLQHPKKRPAEKPSPLILPSNNKKHGLSSQESIEDDRKLEDILKGAKQIRNFIPEPLSGIETPHKEVDWNTQKQKRNVYAMAMPPFNPFRVDDSNNSRSSSPQKKLSESSSEAAHASPMRSGNKESSSSEQDSSSESDKSDSNTPEGVTVLGARSGAGITLGFRRNLRTPF